jgi:hypothetical protein
MRCREAAIRFREPARRAVEATRYIVKKKKKEKKR